MVTAALQESGRAEVVGERSMGRGHAQSLFSLPGGLAIRFPTLRYLSPLGDDWNGRGLEPDHPISEPDTLYFPPWSPADPQVDSQLDAAKRILWAAMSSGAAKP